MNAATQASYLHDQLQHNTGLNSKLSCLFSVLLFPFSSGPPIKGIVKGPSPGG